MVDVLTLIAYVALLVAYFYFPRWLKIVTLVINLFIPDPLPFIDEIIMIIGLFVPQKTRNKP